MKGRAVTQAIAGAVVFLVLVWFINSKASTVDWEHVFVLRVAILGLLSISLMIWSTKNQGSFKKTTEHRWFGYALGFAVVALLFYVYVRPWVGEMQREAEMTRVAQERARVEYIRMHEDTETKEVATENKPLRIIQRSGFERILVAPVGYVSYKVVYPSPVDGSLITLIRKRESGHVDLPSSIKWAEYRPLNTDSVIFIVKRHNLQ